MIMYLVRVRATPNNRVTDCSLKSIRIVKDVIYNIKAVRFKPDNVTMVRVQPIDELIHLSARGKNWEVVTEVQI